MRVKHWLVGGVLLASAASAQEYTWTDERGGIHMASEPSEIPVRYRDTAVHAAGDSERVKIVPTEPTPSGSGARKAKPAKPERTQAERETAYRYEMLKEQNDNRDRAQADRERDDRMDAAREREEKRENADFHLDASKAKGFEKRCQLGPKEVECSMEETEDVRMQRMQDSLDKAQEELGVDAKDLEEDPSLNEEIQKRGLEKFDQSDPDPHYAESSEDD
jgi:hypothetical protein